MRSLIVASAPPTTVGLFYVLLHQPHRQGKQPEEKFPSGARVSQIHENAKRPTLKSSQFDTYLIASNRLGAIAFLRSSTIFKLL
ncbi:MAG: hypothetical protein AB1861_18155 [Cyanobacteriota bacterium]